MTGVSFPQFGPEDCLVIDGIRFEPGVVARKDVVRNTPIETLRAIATAHREANQILSGILPSTITLDDGCDLDIRIGPQDLSMSPNDFGLLGVDIFKAVLGHEAGHIANGTYRLSIPENMHVSGIYGVSRCAQDNMAYFAGYTLKRYGTIDRFVQELDAFEAQIRAVQSVFDQHQIYHTDTPDSLALRFDRKPDEWLEFLKDLEGLEQNQARSADFLAFVGGTRSFKMKLAEKLGEDFLDYAETLPGGGASEIALFQNLYETRIKPLQQQADSIHRIMNTLRRAEEYRADLFMMRHFGPEASLGMADFFSRFMPDLYVHRVSDTELKIELLCPDHNHPRLSQRRAFLERYAGLERFRANAADFIYVDITGIGSGVELWHGEKRIKSPDQLVHLLSGVDPGAVLAAAFEHAVRKETLRPLFGDPALAALQAALRTPKPAA